jgi:hypothetical protein
MSIKIPKIITSPGKYRKAYFEPGEIYNLKKIDFIQKVFDCKLLPESIASNAVFSNFKVSKSHVKVDVNEYEDNYNGYYGVLGRWDNCNILSNRLFDVFLESEYVKHNSKWNFWNYSTKILETDPMVFLNAVSHSSKQKNQFGFASPISLTTELQFFNIRTEKGFSIFPSIQEFEFENVSKEVKAKKNKKNKNV